MPSESAGRPQRRGEPAAPAAGDSFRLRRDEGAAAGARRVASERAQRAVERLRDAGPGEVATAVHGARKDLKKIRSVLRLIRTGLGAKAYRRENRAYRDAAQLLSASRDAEVKIATLRGLGGLPGSQAAGWLALLEADRERLAGAGAEGNADAEGAIEAIDTARARIPEWGLDKDSWPLLEPGIDRTYRDGRAALRATRDEGSAASVHALRKRVKDLWYQLRLLENAWPEPLTAAASEAHRLSDLLGDHHDLSLLGEDLGSRPGLAIDRARAEELIAVRQRGLLDEGLALASRLYAEKPSCYRRRLRTYWHVWKRAEAEPDR